MVAALRAVFTALELERPHVVGHSLGGLIALRLAQAGLTRTVTALAPPGFWNHTERRYAFAVLTAARRIARLPQPALARLSATLIGRAVLTGTLYGRPDLCRPDAVLACLRTLREAVGFEATLHAGRAPDLFTGDIPDVPVTIAWGTRDRVLPPRQATRATTMI
ncbi:MAG: alpha/beta hydrolase fold protein, partial [Actinoallomurus sp.]|nr:alpha/beta hydrolase fold protein [Actinoallomurus sp.]